MPETDHDQFQKMLNIALEDLVNTKPDNPYKYLAVALCRALPSEELDEQEFPEIADALKQHTYPEGFSPYRRRKSLLSLCVRRNLFNRRPRLESSRKQLRRNCSATQRAHAFKRFVFTPFRRKLVEACQGC